MSLHLWGLGWPGMEGEDNVITSMRPGMEGEDNVITSMRPGMEGEDNVLGWRERIMSLHL